MVTGLRHAPTFDMFFPTFIKDLESFTVRMPTTYVQILLTARAFTAGDDIKFQLQPRAYDQQGKIKKADTGDFWAHVSIHPHSVLPQADAFAFLKSQFSRVSLNPVNIEPHKDKKSGTGTNKIRVGFLPMDNFDGIQSNKVPFHIRCNCGDDSHKAGSSSGINRTKATEAYQQRALKRAREDPDPFA